MFTHKHTHTHIYNKNNSPEHFFFCMYYVCKYLDRKLHFAHICIHLLCTDMILKNILYIYKKGMH